MKHLRKRLTYSNVMSSIAVFLVLGGATAFAASQLGKNSVGSKQLKKNAVTSAKLKKNAVTTAKLKNSSVNNSKIAANAVNSAKVQDGSLTGADINVGTLGTVPSAATAGTANAVANRTPFGFYMGAGTRDIATLGAFKIQAKCEINNVGGEDIGALLLSTTEKNSTMDNNSGPEKESFGPEDSPLTMFDEGTSTGATNIEAGEGFVAAAPGGTIIASESQAVGVNVAGHLGQCFFSGVIDKLG